MVVLGVVLVLLALAAGILLVAGVASLEGTIDVSVPGGTLSLPPLTFLVTGMVVISVFWLGWVVLRTGVRHGRRRRAEAREAAKEAEAKRVAEEQRLKEEFAARERQLIEERRRHDSETAELKREADATRADASRTEATGPASGATGPASGANQPASSSTTSARSPGSTAHSNAHAEPAAAADADARIEGPISARQGEHADARQGEQADGSGDAREEPGEETGRHPRA